MQFFCSWLIGIVCFKCIVMVRTKVESETCLLDAVDVKRHIGLRFVLFDIVGVLVLRYGLKDGAIKRVVCDEHG